MIEQTHHQDRRIVVVGVDSSPGTKTGLRWALGQARTSGAAVEAVTAWQDPVVYDGWVPTPVDGDAIAVSAERALRNAVVEVRENRDQPVDVRITVVEGPAAQVLPVAVKSAGHGAFAGIVPGSVSQHCVQHPPCVVAVIPEIDPA